MYAEPVLFHMRAVLSLILRKRKPKSRAEHILNTHPRTTMKKKTITPAQRKARKKNIRKALAARWK